MLTFMKNEIHGKECRAETTGAVITSGNKQYPITPRVCEYET